tara:strand:+ start:85 stop:366 length:282 start_codon:yes stop_codon:yes gene_type:complete
MAEILDDYNFSDHVGYRGKYPYDKWFDGKIRELTSKVDFDVNIDSLRVCIYNAAKRRSLRVRTSITQNGESLVIQAVLRHPPYMPDIEFGGEG